MIGNGGESTGFEVGIVVPKKKEWNFSRVRGFHCVDSMVMELEKVGLMVERIQGISDEFIKVGFISSFLCYTSLSLFII